MFESESPHNLGSDKLWLTSEQAREVYQSKFKKFRVSQYALETTYGLAVQSTNYAYCLEFYPRQRLAKDLIVKAANMLEEAVRLAQGDRAVASLPGVVETLKLL